MQKAKPKYQDEEWLREQYWEKNKTTYEIVEMCDISSQQTISNWLEKLGIEKRHTHNRNAEYKDKKTLKKLYKDQKKTIDEIAEKFDVSHSVIYRYLERNNIRIRTRGEAQQKRKDWQDKEWLKEQYWEKDKSQAEIANSLNVCPSTIRNWMEHDGLETRETGRDTLTEAELKRMHEAGGIRYDPNSKYTKKEWLETKYVEEEKSASEIGDICGACTSTILNWLRKLNIETRPSNKGAQEIIDGKKRCSVCGEMLSLDRFISHSNRSTGLTSQCKSCRNEYMKERRNNDPKCKLNFIMGTSISHALRDNKANRHWEDLVPYGLEDLKAHLEGQFKDGMTWDNHGLYGWHIDHIIPRSYFDYEDPEDEEFQECWALDNLQPLWAEENLKKNDKLNWEAENE